MSTLWGDDVPTSEIDHSGPRLRRLLLHSLLIEPPHHLFLLSNVHLGEEAHSCPVPPARNVHPVAARDHPPTRASPVSVPAHQKTFACLPLTRHFQSPTPPSLPCLRHACRIPTAADPLMPPKYLLTWPSAVVKLPPSTTTVPGAPPVSPSYTPQI